MIVIICISSKQQLIEMHINNEIVYTAIALFCDYPCILLISNYLVKVLNVLGDVKPDPSKTHSRHLIHRKYIYIVWTT